MSDSCHSEKTVKNPCCPSEDSPRKFSFDYILWPSVVMILFSYIHYYLGLPGIPEQVFHFSHGAVELMNEMWWGLLLSIVFVGWLGRIPREVVMGIMGTKSGFSGLIRATLAGLVLDLCNHGILVVGMRLYERGASLGQVVAFLVASPWNSFSMTVILIALVGFKYTLIFIVLSCVIALTSGFIMDKLVSAGRLPANANSGSLPQDLDLKKEIKKSYANIDWSAGNFAKMIWEGFKDSKMILRWIFFGVVLAAVIRMIMNPEAFQTWFGPTLVGLGLTLVAATIIEVCSEGSAPIAADLVNLARAPGNGFTFLMAGASTDYTEIMSLRETTGSWKIALFLPLVTVPQVVALGFLINVLGGG